MTEQSQSGAEKQAAYTLDIDGTAVVTDINEAELTRPDDGRRVQIRHMPDGEPVIVKGKGTVDGQLVDIVQGEDGLHWLPARAVSEETPEVVAPEALNTTSVEVTQRGLGRRSMGGRLRDWLIRDRTVETAVTPPQPANPYLQPVTIVDHTGKQPQKRVILNSSDMQQ